MKPGAAQARKLIPYQGLKGKFLVAFLTIIGVSAVVSCAIVSNYEGRVHRDSLKNKGTSFSRFVADFSKDPLLNHDTIALDNIVKSITSDSEVAYALVYDLNAELLTGFFPSINLKNGTVRAVLKRMPKGRPLAESIAGLRNDEGVREVTEVVTVDTQKIGTVVIGLSETRINKVIERSLGFVLLGNLAGCGIALLFLLVMQRVFINPILRLAGVMKGVTGSKDYSLRVSGISNDELGDLSAGFNNMLEEVQSRDAELKAHRDNLENEVVLRTQELMKEKEALAGMEERFRQVAAESGEFIWEVDASGRYTYASPLAEKVYGYPPEEIVGKKHFYEFFPEEVRDEVKKGALEIFAQKAAFKDFVNPVVNRWGERVLLSTSAMPILGGQGQLLGYRGVDRDITLQRKAEDAIARTLAELQIAKEKADLASRSKSQFLANISHEIRTPLNAILGFGNLLQGTTLDPAQKDYVDTITDSGTVLLSLVNDVLDIAKIEADSVQIEKISFDLEDLVGSVLKMVKPSAGGKALDLSYEFPSGRPSCFMGDPTRIYQILMNLTGNAVKFTERGEIRVVVTVDGASDGPGRVQRVRLAVIDTGIGIPPDKLGAIFEVFTQADETTTRKYGGTGLGLSIARSLARKMGGDIEVFSKDGKGSEFTLTLPLEIAPPSAGGDDLAAIKGRKIAIVDDSEIALKLFEKYCKESGMDVVFLASRAEQLLAWLEHAQDLPAIILTDIVMPEMNGIVLARRLRESERFRRIKIIAITADASPEIAEALQRIDLNGFLSKPVLRQKLLGTMAAVLGVVPAGKTASPRNAPAGASLLGVRVLAVDDKSSNQKLLKVYLDVFGCISDFASNGQEAVEKIRKNTYDICLMDIQMPVMGGLEAAELLRRDVNRDIPILALTASAMKADEQKALDSGMNGYLTKPIDIRKLEELLLKWTKGPRAPAVPWDKARAREALGMDEASFNGLFRAFLIEVDEDMQKLAAAIASDDNISIAQIGHGIKGMAANLRVTRVQEAARELESLARDGQDKHLITIKAAVLKQELDSLRQIA